MVPEYEITIMDIYCYYSNRIKKITQIILTEKKKYFRHPLMIFRLISEEALEYSNVIYQTAEDGLSDTIKPRLLASRC